METVQLAYVKAHLLMPEATHIMVTYKVAGNGGQVDDREHFGSEQLKKLGGRKSPKHRSVCGTKVWRHPSGEGPLQPDQPCGGGGLAETGPEPT